MITTEHRPRTDSAAAEAVDPARAALVAQVGESVVGVHLGVAGEGDRVVTHYFDCTQAGYPGWRWAVTVARASRQKNVTVDEVVLLPGDEAITAPAWVPWRERLQPGDLSPGDLLPVDEDDPRLVPAYLSEDEIDDEEEFDRATLQAVSDELGLGRPRVLSIEGRDLAAERWYDGEQGPDTPLAQSAPGTCIGCGFMIQLAGPLSRMFGVCTNAFANDDGRVVSIDHGCGAHSEAQLRKKQLPPVLPDHVHDTLSRDDFEQF